MQKHGINAYVQPVHDEYMSEYPPTCNQRVKWLCGFSGSAGAVVVLEKKAALFVDGRYTLQAKNEVDGALFEQHNITDLAPEQWAAKHLRGDLGYDPKLYSSAMVRRMENAGLTLAAMPNLVDAIWKDRPQPPQSKIYAHDIKYSGERSADKRARIAKQLKADAALLTAPDSVNWLLNIRGSDTEGTPLALCVALLDAKGRAQLFVPPDRVDAKTRAHLGRDVELCDPDTLPKKLAAWKKKNVQVDMRTTPMWYVSALEKSGVKTVEGQDPCQLPKAMKNVVELAGMRAAHVRDGAAVVKLLCWLENQKRVSEIDIAEKLLSFRQQNDLFVEPSFPTIAGSGPNGAIVHYRADEKSNRALKANELLLLDSGGQYHDGTTDITRTIAIGKPGRAEKESFTRVLKGHIAIATAQFPEGTSGSQLDALARQYLWQAGLDYDHGTGHGVGCFLGVHEGPQRISKRGGDAKLLPGMILSNEPGYYKAGAYGIRIENLVAVAQAKKGWLAFETITCAPIDTRLIETSMLSAAEKEWLNAYHAWVQKTLSPLLGRAERDWLKNTCCLV